MSVRTSADIGNMLRILLLKPVDRCRTIDTADLLDYSKNSGMVRRSLESYFPESYKVANHNLQISCTDGTLQNLLGVRGRCFVLTSMKKEHVM